MALYDCSLKNPISRGKGKSAVAKAAYNAREKMRDERTNELKDYSRGRGDILFSGIFIDPKRNAPEWAKDRAALWNAAVAAEKRRDAREAQELIVNLPHELTQQQRENMLKDFVREHITRGTARVADVNMHKAPEGGDKRNIHAHILMTVREIGADGFTGGKRLEIDTAQLLRWKEKWAERGAKELRRAGFEIEADRWAVGHLPKEQQRQAALERGDLAYAEKLHEPATQHKGPAVSALERKGIETERGKIQQQEFDAARELTKLKRELAQVTEQLREAERTEQRKPERDAQPRPEPTRTARELHFEDAAHQATRNAPAPHIPSELRGTAAEIWKAYNLRTWEQKQKQPDGTIRVKEIELKGAPDPYQFAATLDAKGIALAQVTKEEAKRSHREAAFAKELGNHAPTYREGEFVAVNKRGDVYRFTEKNTGHDRQDVQQFLNKAEWHGINSLDATRQIMQARATDRATQRQARSEQIASARFDRATNLRDPLPRLSAADTKKVIRVAHRALGKGVNLVGGTVSAFTKAFESLFAPPTPLTRAQIKEQNIRSENAARDHAEVAGKQILYDVQQERIDNASRERDDADRRHEAEKWRKEQDRGGRERER